MLALLYSLGKNQNSVVLLELSQEPLFVPPLQGQMVLNSLVVLSKAGLLLTKVFFGYNKFDSKQRDTEIMQECALFNTIYSSSLDILLDYEAPQGISLTWVRQGDSALHFISGSHASSMMSTTKKETILVVMNTSLEYDRIKAQHIGSAVIKLFFEQGISTLNSPRIVSVKMFRKALFGLLAHMYIADSRKLLFQRFSCSFESNRKLTVENWAQNSVLDMEDSVNRPSSSEDFVKKKCHKRVCLSVLVFRDYCSNSNVNTKRDSDRRSNITASATNRGRP